MKEQAEQAAQAAQRVQTDGPLLTQYPVYTEHTITDNTVPFFICINYI